MKTAKRYISLLVAIVLLVGLIPVYSSIVEARTPVSTVPSSVLGQTDGVDTVIYNTDSTYVVWSGKLKVTGSVDRAAAPAIALRVTGADSWGKDTFRLVYTGEYDSKIELGGYEGSDSDKKTVDNVDVWKNQSQGCNTGLEKVFDAGLDIRLVRMDTWAYLYAKTGDKYELVGKRDIDAGAPTTLALGSKNIGSATYAMTDIQVVEGKDAALEALDGKMNLDAGSIYIPVDSTNWTLEGTLHSNTDNWWRNDDDRRVILAGSDTWNHTISVTFFRDTWFGAERVDNWTNNGLYKPTFLEPCKEGNAGARIRWVREENTLSFYVYEFGEWTLYMQNETLSEAEKGIYLFTCIDANTNLSDISLTTENVPAVRDQIEGDDTVIYETDSTYVVLEGKLKVTGIEDFADAPTFALRVTGEDSWGKDTFRLVYPDEDNSKVELGGYEGSGSDLKTVDNIDVWKNQSQRWRSGLEKAFTSGLDIRLVRMNTWAYLYAKTGDKYELVGKRDITADAPTSFALSSRGILDAFYEMTSIRITEGKDAAMAALNGKMNLDDGSIYIPVDSTSWTLEGTMHSNKDDWWQAWPDPSRIIAAGSNTGDHTISMTMFENWGWFGAEKGTSGESAEIGWNIVDASPEDQAGARLRWVREENMLSFYIYNGAEWKLYQQIDTLSVEEEGIYLLTRIQTNTNLSDINLTVNQAVEAYEPNVPSIQNLVNGNDTVIYETDSPYAVLDGRITVSGIEDFESAPTLALRISGADSWGKDTFRLVYPNENESKVELGGYEGSTSDVKTVDNVDVWKNQSQGTRTGLEKALSYGLNIRLVRMNTWAYLYAKTGDEYVLVAKRDITADARTTFALGSAGIGNATYEMTCIRVTEGRDAGLAVLDGKINLDAGSIYIPLNSTDWALEGTMHSNKDDWWQAWPDPSRIIMVGSDTDEHMISMTMFENWGWFGAEKGTTGVSANIDWDVVDASPEDQAGARLRWVRQGNTLSFYIYRDTGWRLYQQIDNLNNEAVGLYLLTGIRTNTNLSDVRLTVNNTVLPQQPEPVVRYKPEIEQHPLADLTSIDTTASVPKTENAPSSTSLITGDTLGVLLLIFAVLLLSSAGVAVCILRRRRIQK